VAQTIAAQIADLLETQHDAFAESLLREIPLLQTEELRAVIEEWYECDVAFLRGRTSRTYECLSVYCTYVRRHGISLGEALTTLQQVREHLYSFCQGKMAGVSDEQVLHVVSGVHDRWVNQFSRHYSEGMQKDMAAERRLQFTIADTTERAVALVNMDGVIELANTAFCTLTGIPQESVKSRSFADLCMESTAGEIRRFLRQRVGAANPRHFEGMLQSGKGFVTRRRFTVLPVFDGDGLKSGLVIALEQIREETGMRKALESRVLEALTAAQSTGLVIWSSDGSVVYRNALAQELLDLDEESNIQVCCGRQFEHGGVCGDCFRGGVFESNETFRATVRHEGDGQHPRWVEIVSVPIHVDDGMVSHVAVIAYDVTSLKTLENQILRQQSTSLVAQLAVGIAHELRNPLSVMIGFSQMLSEGLPADKVGDAATKLLRNGLRCKEIVDHLLEFGRELPSERFATDINALVMEHVRPMYPASVSQRITWKLGSNLAAVECAPQQITQVFVNLIDNALWAAQSRVVVESLQQDDRVYIRVCDDGPGISEDLRRRIFEPFYTTRGEEGCVGLGLSLSQSVVQEHQGQLSLDETVAAGACFIVQLPAMREQMAPPCEPAETRKREHAPSILLVDDELDLLEMLATVLRMRGYAVDTAATGANAADLIAANDYDLVVLDVLLPGDLGGRELYQLIKGSKPAMAASTLFITADTMKYETRRFLSEVERPHMEKPFLVSEFEEKIASMLDSATAMHSGKS
jgi:PAS domain S-box-containing protein